MPTLRLSPTQMPPLTISTPRLDLVLESTEDVLSQIDAMPPEDRAEVSPAWLERLRASPESTPWTHFFSMRERASGRAVGGCGFKGGPDADGVVEISYGVDPESRGKGYAKEAARGLTEWALGSGSARGVIAHTRPENGASGRVLEACGFEHQGEVIDPEDGLVWRWRYVGR